MPIKISGAGVSSNMNGPSARAIPRSSFDDSVGPVARVQSGLPANDKQEPGKSNIDQQRASQGGLLGGGGSSSGGGVAGLSASAQITDEELKRRRMERMNSKMATISGSPVLRSGGASSYSIHLFLSKIEQDIKKKQKKSSSDILSGLKKCMKIVSEIHEQREQSSPEKEHHEWNSFYGALSDEIKKVELLLHNQYKISEG